MRENASWVCAVFLLFGCAEGPVGPAGPEGPSGTSGVPGAPGADGTAGADGQLRIWGDGSAGAKTVSADETLADANLQYTDFTVASGVTLTVESGTVIRCSGTFTNDGTIVVSFGAWGGVVDDPTGAGVYAAAPAHPGISSRAASAGGRGAAPQKGGLGGAGLTVAQARALVLPGLWGGGGGGSGVFTGGAAQGGGSFVVIARAALVNHGSILANGQDINPANELGGGGGGGGFVVLASRVSVTSSGPIEAKGSHGTRDNGMCFGLSGGGGGGGVVHFIAPAVDVSVAPDVSGGVVGAAGCWSSGNVTGGGGGGASGGNGGRGGGVWGNGTQIAPTAGSPGHVLETEADPSALF